ncbi:MAG: MarR family transcriptional regulator [Thermoplasmata archaeon]
MNSPGGRRTSSRKRPNPALVEQVQRALRCANQAVTARLRLALLREGLPFSRFVVLRLLVIRGPTTSKALAGAMGVTTANMPGLIDRLEADGLVTRTRNRKDRREILVEATRKGRRTLLRLKDTAVDGLVEAFDGWTEVELRALLKSLKRFTGPPHVGDLIELGVPRSSSVGGRPIVVQYPRSRRDPKSGSPSVGGDLCAPRGRSGGGHRTSLRALSGPRKGLETTAK